MRPVNSKSLFAFVCDQMEKLDSKEISVEQAKAQSLLVKQANNILKYEIDRANTLVKISEHNRITGENIYLRDVETKKLTREDFGN